MARKQKSDIQRSKLQAGLAPVQVIHGPDTDEFMKHMIRYHDQVEAVEIVSDYYLQSWMAGHGSELEALKVQIDEADRNYKTSQEHLERVQARLACTQPYIRCEAPFEAKPDQEEGSHAR